MTLTRPLRAALIAADGLVGLTAVGGGIAMAAGLEDFPERWLERTPFAGYLLPGLLLSAVVGASAVTAAAATIHSPVVGGYASMGAGAALAIWIGAEIALLPSDARHWIEPLYLGLAAAMIGIGAATAQATRVAEAEG